MYPFSSIRLLLDYVIEVPRSKIWVLDLKFRLLQILVHIPAGFGRISLRGRARTVFMDW